MQNSELYRRGFVVPLNKDAELALVNNHVNEQTEVEFFEIPNDRIFENLWVKGLFKKINEDPGLMIDDYAEDVVDNSKINRLNEVVKTFRHQTKLDFEEAAVISALERLLDIARKMKSPIFFIM